MEQYFVNIEISGAMRHVGFISEEDIAEKVLHLGGYALMK